MTDSAELDRLLTTAVRAAHQASAEILSVYEGEFAVDRKEDTSPITEADRRSSRVIVAELARAHRYPVLSEEEGQIPYEQRRHWSRFWLVDPLDGTKEFVKRNGEFTINIAFLEHGVPVLGVVYAPVPDLLYFAHDGIGAYGLSDLRTVFPELPSADEQLLIELRGKSRRLERRASLVLDPERKLPSITVMGSRSHRNREFDEYLDRLKETVAEKIELTISGSALKACVVAEGRADIYPRFGRTMEWDTAAPHAIVRAVGKRMADYESGEELRYNKAELCNSSFLVY